MAKVSLKNLHQAFSMEEHYFAPLRVSVELEADLYRFLANMGGDHRVSVKGTGFEYDFGYPFSGTIKRVELDLGDNNNAAPDFVVTGLQADFRWLDPRDKDLDTQTAYAYAMMLGGDDTIDLGSNAGKEHFAIRLAGDGSWATTFGGNDKIRGDAGDGTISGDLLEVRQGLVRYGGDDDIRLKGAFMAAGDAVSVNEGGTLFGGDDYLSVTGGMGARIIGDATNVFGNLRGGDDRIVGSAHGDTLIGDTDFVPVQATYQGGDDSIRGGDGKDEIHGDAVVVYSSITKDGNDRLYGEGGADSLWGGGGNDWLDGGNGKDVLTGGAGRDQFRFAVRPSSSQVDTITDFQHGIDKIALDDAIFKALGDGVARSEFRAVKSGHAADSTDHLIYNKSNGTLWYDADDNGQGAAVQIAILSNAPQNLGHSDFVII